MLQEAQSTRRPCTIAPATHTHATSRRPSRPCSSKNLPPPTKVRCRTLSHTAIQSLKVERGTALTDLLNGVYDMVLHLELPPNARAYLLDQMAQIEYRLSTSASERIQLAALLGAVKAAVELSQA